MFNIEVQRKSKKTIKAILIRLNDKVLRFNGDATIKLEKVNKEKEIEEPNLFSCFNDYVEGIFDTERKITLFKLFEKAHGIVEGIALKDYELELTQVKPVVNDIISFIIPSKFCSFIQYSNHMVVPPELSVAASKGDYPSETTITEYDYKEIVKTTFLIRVIYPIIFSLVARYSTKMNPSYAEQLCGQLIKDNYDITSMYGWRKLETYVNFAFNKRGIPQQVDVIGSQEYFIEKVLYNTIFSRLCCAVIPETEEDKNLATAINAAMRQHESSGSVFRKKDGSEGEEDKRSLLERYQINEEVKSTNEVMAAEFFSMGLFDENDAERHKDLFKYPCLALGIKNQKLVERIYENISPTWEIELNDHIIKLLQMTFIDDVPSMIFWACDFIQLTAAISLGQVKLAEQGYTYLPSLLGAIHDPDGMRSLSDGLKLSSDDKNYLDGICDIQSRNDEGRSFNEVIEAATELLDHFGNGRWKSNLEYGVLDDPEIYYRVEKGALFSLEIESQIKNEFMRLMRQNNQ